MLTLRLHATPTSRTLRRIALRIDLHCMQLCAAYHASRASSAHAGIRYARDRGTLPQYDGYYQEIINESASWLKWSHERMVVIKSDLRRV